MDYTLYDNGIDSLKAAKTNLEEFINNNEDGEHFLKDSIIFLNHGIEILLKYLISQKDISLLFTNTDKYLNAKKQMNSEKHKDVFDVNPKLRTINLETCIEKYENECSSEIPKKFKDVITYVLKYRNKLMHYNLQLEENEVEEFVDKLCFCFHESIKFFSSKIKGFDSSLSESREIIRSLDALKIQYELLQDEIEESIMLADKQAYEDYQADMFDALESYAIKSGE